LIYNDNTGKYIEANKKDHTFNLKTVNNTYKKISLKPLYQLVYGKIYCIDKIEDINNEVWKEIKGSNKKYYISNYGRVKSYTGYEAKILKQNKPTFRFFVDKTKIKAGASFLDVSTGFDLLHYRMNPTGYRKRHGKFIRTALPD
jgi:hypothetical protein